MGATVLVVTAAAAGAHPVLLHSDPAAGTVVARRPHGVSLTFGEPIAPLAQIRVYNDRGLRVDRGATHSHDRAVTVSLVPSLKPGTYVVHWRAVGVDGHPASDSLVFDYLRATRAGVVHESRDTTSRARGVFRWCALVLFAIVLGHALLTRHSAVRPWAAATVIAVALLLASDAAGLSGLSIRRAIDWSVLTQVLHTSTGHARLVQLAASTGGLVVPVLAVPAMVVALFVEAFAGHAVVAPHPVVAEVVQGGHVVAMGVWLGGLAVIARRSRRTPDVVARWRAIALSAVVALLITGTVNGFIQIGTVARLLHTGYGQLLIAKVVVFAAVIAVAWWNHRGGERPRFVAAELVGVVVIVVMAVTLSALAAPRNGSGPVSRVFTLGPWRASFVVDPARTGANEVHLFLLHGVGELGTDVASAQVVVSHGGERADVHLREEGRGHYVTESGALRTRGRWTADITAVRTDGSLYATRQQFTIAP